MAPKQLPFLTIQRLNFYIHNRFSKPFRPGLQLDPSCCKTGPDNNHCFSVKQVHVVSLKRLERLWITIADAGYVSCPAECQIYFIHVQWRQVAGGIQGFNQDIRQVLAITFKGRVVGR